MAVSAPTQVAAFTSTADVPANSLASANLTAGVAAGSVVVVEVVAGQTGVTVAVSDTKGHTYTVLTPESTAGVPTSSVTIAYAVVSTAMSTSDSVRVSRGDSGSLLWRAHALTGVDTSTPLDASGAIRRRNVTATTQPANVPSLTVGAGALVMMAVSHAAGQTATAAGSGYTLAWNAAASGGNNPRGGSVVWRQSSAAETTQPSLSNILNPWAAIGLAFKAAPTGTPTSPPTADAGADQTAPAGTTVTLSGTGTPTSGDTIASHAWQQLSGPAVTLTGSGATRTFVAPYSPSQAVLTFRLTVTDDDGETGTDDVTVTIPAHTEWYMRADRTLGPLLDGLQPEPPAPASVTISGTPGDTEASVTWEIDAGGQVVTGAVVTRSGSGAPSYTRTGLTGTQKFTGLTNGTAYTLQVTPVVGGSPDASLAKSVVVTPTATSGGGGTAPLLGFYPYSHRTAFDREPELSTVYGQFGAPQSSAPNDSATPTYAGWNLAQMKERVDRGTATMASWTLKYTNRIAWGGPATVPTSGTPKTRYDQVMAAGGEVDDWWERLQALAEYNPAVPVYGTIAHEHDVYGNPTKTGSDNYYDGDSESAAFYGRFMSRAIARARVVAPNVRVGVWFGGSRTDHILTVLQNLTVAVDWISFDPYVQQATFETPLQNFKPHVDRCRNENGTYYTEYQRLSGLLGRELPILITEHGVSYRHDLDKNGVYEKRHPAAKRVEYVRGIREAMAELRIAASIYFNSSGPNGDYDLAAAWSGEDPQDTIEAMQAELDEAPTGGGTSGGRITAISAPTTIGDPDSSGAIKENSGMVVSRKNGTGGVRVLWEVDDQGSSPVVRAFEDRSAANGGKVLHTLTITGVTPATSVQFEDLSKCKMPDGSEGLLVGRIGDGYRTLIRVPEPEVTPGQAHATSSVAGEEFPFTQLQSPSNHEAMAVDPISGDVFICGRTGGTSPRAVPVWRIAASKLVEGGESTPINPGAAVARVTVSAAASTSTASPTAMDISDDGKAIMIAEYQTVSIWWRDPATQTVEQALRKGGNATTASLPDVTIHVPATAANDFGAEAYCFDSGPAPKIGLCMKESQDGNATLKRFGFTYTGGTTTAGSSSSTTRDVYAQPFLSSSIWNTPIGSDAVLVDAGMAPALGATNQRLTCDPIEICLDPSAPSKTLTTYGYVKTAAGVTNAVTPGWSIPAPGYAVRIADTLLHDGKWNGITALLSADPADGGRYFYSGQPLWREATADDPKWPYTLPNPNIGGAAKVDLYGDGLEKGAHGGSRLSALGGVLRAWEWNGTEPIRHVLSINTSGYRFLSTAGGGFRWPATHADDGYDTVGGVNTNHYGRTGTGFDGMRMGSLLCLPADFDLDDVTDPQAKRIAWTLQHFGAYIADNTKRDAHAVSVEASIETAWNNAGTTFHSQMQDIFSALVLVDNNAPGSIGGGGTPRTTPVPQVYPPVG